MPLFLTDMNVTFDFIGDEMPPNRVKVLHATGVVGLFEFVSSGNHPFTGSFKGTDHGIFRISEVGTVAEDRTPSGSAAFKYLRDGVDAGNHMTVHSGKGHPDTYNFLKLPYHTHIP